jgi:hypothetical protein
LLCSLIVSGRLNDVGAAMSDIIIIAVIW